MDECVGSIVVRSTICTEMQGLAEKVERQSQIVFEHTVENCEDGSRWYPLCLGEDALPTGPNQSRESLFHKVRLVCDQCKTTGPLSDLIALVLNRESLKTSLFSTCYLPVFFKDKVESYLVFATHSEAGKPFEKKTAKEVLDPRGQR